LFISLTVIAFILLLSFVGFFMIKRSEQNH